MCRDILVTNRIKHNIWSTDLLLYLVMDSITDVIDTELRGQTITPFIYSHCKLKQRIINMRFDYE